MNNALEIKTEEDYPIFSPSDITMEIDAANYESIKIEDSNIKIDLYDVNKQIIAQLPVLENLDEKIVLINNLHNQFGNQYYMLYGKEISYFTLFKIIQPIYFGNEVISCLNYIGKIKAIDFTEAQDAIEIWVEDSNGPTCLYLFPYDNGVVQVGE